MEGVDQQDANAELGSKDEAAIDGMSEQKLTVPTPRLRLRHRESGHSDRGDRVARQPLSIGLSQVGESELGRRERIEPEDLARVPFLDEDVRRRDAVAVMLRGLLTQIAVERGLATLERRAVVPLRIEQYNVQRHVVTRSRCVAEAPS